MVTFGRREATSLGLVETPLTSEWAQANPDWPGPEAIRDHGGWILYAIVACGFLILISAHAANALFRPVWATAASHRWAQLALFPSVLWTIMATVLLGFRTILWLRYRPHPLEELATAPSLTVIIPVYNEGAMVLKSIESVATALYPRERLEIFVVDDGSRDDTWNHVQCAAARFPNIVKAIRLPENRGKRAALALGFQKARGEIVVTLDSDSVIDRDALLAVAGPFRNPKVGAAAGKVVVYNRHEGLIPRMLHVRYVLSFDFLRAAESIYGTVYCCPGALTAYRTSLVRKLLDSWLGQKFLGSPCTVGEDRALTNLILSSGYDTVYQRSAVVRTLVPATYSKLCKMFIRWDRSYVREEIYFLRFVWKRPPGPRLIAFFDRFVTNSRYLVNYACLGLLAAFMVGNPQMILRFLLAIGLASLLYVPYYLRSERSADFLYGVVYSYFAVFTLFWIFPYAAFTVRARSWLTR